MKVLIHNDRSSAEADAARRIATAVRRNPRIVLGLATGRTPVAIYAHLAGEVAAGRLSFRHAQTFNLDEYVGIGAQDPQSFRAFMDRHPFSQIDIDPANTHVPQGDAVDPESESVRYEAALHKARMADAIRVRRPLRSGQATAPGRCVTGFRAHRRCINRPDGQS